MEISTVSSEVTKGACVYRFLVFFYLCLFTHVIMCFHLFKCVNATVH